MSTPTPEQYRLKLLSELCQQKANNIWVNRPKGCSWDGIELPGDGSVLYYPSRDNNRYLEESERWEKAAKKLSDLATPAEDKFWNGARSTIAFLMVIGFYFGIVRGLAWYNELHPSDPDTETVEQDDIPTESVTKSVDGHTYIWTESDNPQIGWHWLKTN